MNKRIRKKQIKRALWRLFDAYEEYEAARERTFHKALQIVMDAHMSPRETFQCFMEIASIMTSNGPPLRLLSESCDTVHSSPQN